MAKKYLAKYNKVWQNIKTGKIHGNELELKDSEKLTDYKEILKSTETQDKSKTNKQKNIFDENKGVINS